MLVSAVTPLIEGPSPHFLFFQAYRKDTEDVRTLRLTLKNTMPIKKRVCWSIFPALRNIFKNCEFKNGDIMCYILFMFIL